MVTITEKHRRFLKSEILKSNDLKTFKESIINVVDDIYEELNKIIEIEE